MFQPMLISYNQFKIESIACYFFLMDSSHSIKNLFSIITFIWYGLLELRAGSPTVVNDVIVLKWAIQNNMVCFEGINQSESLIQIKLQYDGIKHTLNTCIRRFHIKFFMCFNSVNPFETSDRPGNLP